MTTVAITGAGRGIGFELARLYAEAGDRVIALCREPARAEALSALADDFPESIIVQRMDVGEDPSVLAAAEALGPTKVDVLFNVAGVVGPTSPELQSSNWAEWDEVLNIMLKGPLRVLQAFLPNLRVGSKVITLTSQVGASTWLYGGYYAYGAAKAGLNRLMRSVACDLKDRGIIVGLIHPGYVQTDMSGPGADITPFESATGIRSITSGWTLEQSGDFLKWNGEAHSF